jgi:2-oxoglutarate ferredoxin oxidoreductase subunit alpha
MPTWTEQGDLLFATQAGHGEFPKIVLAPGDVGEMAELALKAFDLADIYQLPVIIVSDKFLCESYQDLSKESLQKSFNSYTPDRGKIVTQTSQEKYLRYKLEEDGISEMLIPGQKGQFYQANSYEHIEDSHTTEDGKARINQVNKRNAKWTTYLNGTDPHKSFAEPKVYGDSADAEIVFVSWGGMKGIVREAQKMLLRDHNQKTAFIHFTHMFPLNEKAVSKYFEKPKRYILIENNAHAQFGMLLRMLTGIDIKEKFLKYDGRPFWPEEIVEYIFPKTYPQLSIEEQDMLNKIKNSMNSKTS